MYQKPATQAQDSQYYTPSSGMGLTTPPWKILIMKSEEAIARSLAGRIF
jgi:hypothetical protein